MYNHQRRSKDLTKVGRFLIQLLGGILFALFFGLPLGTTSTLVLLGCIWALVMPVLHGFAHLYREQYRMQQLARKHRGDAS